MVTQSACNYTSTTQLRLSNLARAIETIRNRHESYDNDHHLYRDISYKRAHKIKDNDLTLEVYSPPPSMPIAEFYYYCQLALVRCCVS